MTGSRLSFRLARFCSFCVGVWMCRIIHHTYGRISRDVLCELLAVVGLFSSVLHWFALNLQSATRLCSYFWPLLVTPRPVPSRLIPLLFRTSCQSTRRHLFVQRLVMCRLTSCARVHLIRIRFFVWFNQIRENIFAGSTSYNLYTCEYPTCVHDYWRGGFFSCMRWLCERRVLLGCAIKVVSIPTTTSEVPDVALNSTKESAS